MAIMRQNEYARNTPSKGLSISHPGNDQARLHENRPRATRTRRALGLVEHEAFSLTPVHSTT